jgi:hypothetical protein
MAQGAERPGSQRAWAIGRMAAMIVLGAVLAGCDKCGDWWSPMRGQGPGDTQACREQAPPPQ